MSAARKPTPARRKTTTPTPTPTPVPVPVLRVGAAVVVHAFGDRVGRYGCGGVTSDDRTQPEPLRELDPTERAAAYQSILAEMDRMRAAISTVIGGRVTVEICRGCKSNAISGLAGARHALGYDDDPAAAGMND